ncbi:hypothetical protein N7491_007138 [Penicillium cf. griseofulvum]|uniref:Uncharacterized protein n=1 Tax=Penicillium cf. griseofulvum TaxID=2972120 RepID=A0A9W9ITW5_9EURO|nr:hypothetical protein N7472_009834 [Penicillium cf. griseofulvum]KAJ5430122.1 hypothetical protein N7491_007138 [Penicillium cf. griseofulvum]
MPDVEVMGSSEDLQAFKRPLLRSHKTLPQRGVTIPSIEVIQPVSPDQNGKHRATPSLPLTPPGAGHEELVVDERTPRRMNSSLSDMPVSGMLTPRRSSKLPTPDVTPPRTNSSKRPTWNQFSHFSSSSRADSFQTALESISSGEDMTTPVHMSQTATPAAKQRRQPSKPPASSGHLSHFKNIKRSPASAFQEDNENECDTRFESFDGHWAANLIDGSPTPLVGKRKSAQNHTQAVNDSTSARDALDVKHLDVFLMREKRLRDCVNGSHEAQASTSMEQFRENIGSSSSEGLARFSGSDTRPLSVMSSTSTVEAMIIDSPKRAQRMLRHTEKKSSLRSASSPIPRSERTSYGSIPESQHRLVHKAARISDQDFRSSTPETCFSAKTRNSVIQPNIETINVVVIPERSSSLNSRPNSHASSKLGSQRSSRRPPTASTGRTDIPGQKKRTVSDSVSTRSRSRETDPRGCPMARPVIPARASSLSAPTSRNNSRTTSLTSNSLRSRTTERPAIPPRSSSLSAPTSRNNSRATSLTSDSLRSHNLAMEFEIKKSHEHQPVSPPRHNVLASPYRHSLLEAPNMRTLFASSDDMATLRPPSLPFTQGSVPSSSPGPIEIQEATAVSLFAHNNRSLLLVDPRVQASSRGPFQALGISYDFPQPPRTPDNQSQMAMFNADSPLTNPRPPPKPPSATPLLALPLHEAQDENKGLGRRWSSVRRTWSARSRSDSFSNMARSFSMKSAKNRTAGIEMDSRQHPFWRPRGFWEDVPSSPEKEPSPTRQPLPHADESLVVNNSLGLPQRRIIFDGPPALARRSPELRRLFNGMASNGSLVDQGMFRTGSPLNQSRFQSLSRWGLRLQSMSWRNVRNRLRRVRQRRDERKRAVRREALKHSIGGPVYVASSTTAEVAMR